jgi:uncharacterized membrane protein YkoI
MNRLQTMTSAVLALGLSVAVPSFASAASNHNDHNNSRNSSRVEHQAASRTQTRVESRTTTHVERRVEPQRERVVRDVHVDRDYHHDRDYHYGRDFHYDRGIRFGVSVPVYPVYPTAPVYVNTDCDIALNIGDVPACVLDTAGRECGGPIESVRLIRTNGVEFYRLIVDSRDGAYEVHVDGAGRLISMGRC